MPLKVFDSLTIRTLQQTIKALKGWAFEPDFSIIEKLSEIVQRQRGDSCRKHHVERAAHDGTCTCGQPGGALIRDWLRIDTFSARAYIFWQSIYSNGCHLHLSASV